MDRRRTAWTGALLGIGLAGTLDEVLLHQILHWHHFYDRSTSAVGLVSDGLFHVASTMLLLYGMYRLGQHRSWQIPGWARRFWAGVLLGLGGFNLYDGVIQHKVLRLHQVRPGVALRRGFHRHRDSNPSGRVDPAACGAPARWTRYRAGRR